MPIRFKNVEIGLYGQHLAFWLMAAVIFGISYRSSVNLFQNKQRSSASLITGPSSVGSYVKQTIEVLSDGGVIIDGQKRPHIIKVLPNNLELRIKTLDALGFGLATYIVELKLTKPIDQPPLIIEQPLIIHTQFSSQPVVRKVSSQLYTIETQNLGPDAVFTVVARFPPGYLDLPFWYRFFSRFGQELAIWFVIGLSIPLISVIVMIAILYQVHRSRRVSHSKQSFDHPPSQLPPAVVGLLMRGKITNRDIAATLIDLAWRGFIELYSSAEQFSLVKKAKLTKAGASELTLLDKPTGLTNRMAPFERALTNKIFYPSQQVSRESDVMFRVGHRLFSQKIARVYIGIYDMAYQAKLFSHNPFDVHRRYVALGLMIFFIGLIGFAIDSLFFSGPTLLFWVGTLCAGVVISQLGSLVSPLSEIGKQEFQKWLAFKKFLAGRPPIDPQSATQKTFEQYLPYAIIFGVEKQWIGRFARSSFVVPDWFSTPDSVITLEMFAQRLFAMIATTSRLLVSAKDPSVQ